MSEADRAVTRLGGDGLTERQRAVLEVIQASMQDRGYPPSIREICDATGLASTSSVSHQLAALERKGYIRRDARLPRAVDVRPADGSSGAPGSSGTSPHANEGDGAQVSPTVNVPVVGRIAAGVPLLADESVDEVFPLPRTLVGAGTVFLLKVVGESMIDAAIADGDWVAVRQQSTAENGEIVAAMIDGEATVKTWRRRDGHAWLLPANPAFEPIPADDAVVLGKIVAVLRKV
ncbi:transcriptional repressor LexA [Jatrophihabitans sp. YIM 134969]